MTGPEKRAWLYGIAWLGGGVASLAFVAWLVTLIRWDWPAGTESQRLAILGNIAYILLALAALVTLGLSLRNAIRNIKGSAGPVSIEANGHDDLD